MDRPKKRGGAVAIPDDALVEILSRLPVKSLHRCKCVASAWRDLIDDPLVRKILPQTLEGLFVMDKEIRSGRDEGHLVFVDLRHAMSVPLEIKPRFSFLKNPPKNEVLTLSDSGNGLLLFRIAEYEKESLDESNDESLDDGSVDYIVYNPATEHWVAVPNCGCPYPELFQCHGYLAFNPAASSHFHLVQFWTEDFEEDGKIKAVITVHAYSSETQTWSHSQEEGELESWRHRGARPHMGPYCAFVNGMLHFMIANTEDQIVFRKKDQIAVVDVQGKTRWIIPVPAKAPGVLRRGHVAHSQGSLHYVSQGSVYQLSIWVLQDYDTQEWVVKHTVSFLDMFGLQMWPSKVFDVVAVHPDRNLVFLVDYQKANLISYDIDHKLMSVISTTQNPWKVNFAPYVPSSALTNKH